MREWRIIEALDGTDVPHTAGRSRSAPTRRVLGRTFYLMGFVDGWSPMDLSGRLAGPVRHRSRGAGGARVPAGRGIALLSKVDWRAKGLDDLGRPTASTSARSTGGPRSSSGSRAASCPGFDEAAAWLRAHRPIDFIPGLMHGDYQFANVMYRHGAPARLAAIVDWEMGTVGDPKLDLAGSCRAGPRTPAPEAAESSYVDMLGMPSHDQVLEHYAEVSGRQVDDIDYYVILAKWKLAVVLEQGYQRAGDDEKLQPFGPIVLDLMQGAADLAETTDYSGRDREQLVRERRGSVLVAAAQPSGGAQRADAATDHPRHRRRHRRAESDPDVRAVVLTGTGDRAFCAGMDLRRFADGEASAPATTTSPARFLRLLEGEVAVPARRRGQRHRGRRRLRAAARLRRDRRLRPRREFGLPEVKRGLFAAGGGTFLGTRIPLGVALEMTLTGDRIDAARAYELGLRQRGRAAGRGARRRRGARRADRRERSPRCPRPRSSSGWGCPTPLAAERVSYWQDVVFASEDAKEGATAFVEKRAPVWRGR